MEAYLTKKLNFSDCTCPICMSVLIEPVTMPCEHELCMPCFKQNVEEANFTCPLCRKRISTWVRRATKTNGLVNKKRWIQIQKAFPKKVRNRLEGREDDYSSDEELVIIPSIAEPGAIRDEYLKELKKITDEQERMRQLEEEASRKLIQQLANEEEQKRLERERLQREDEALARELTSDMHKDNKLASPRISNFLSEQSRISSQGSSSSNPSNKQFSTFLDNYLVKTPKSGRTDGSDSCNPLLSPMEARQSASRPSEASVSYIYIDSRDSSRVGDFEETEDKLPSLPFVDIKEDSCDSSSLELNLITPVHAKKPESLVIQDSDTNFTLPTSESSCNVYSPMGDTDSEYNQSKCSSSSTSNTKRKKKTNMEDYIKTIKDTGQVKRSRSATSEDSITQELVHFKPIHTSPCTPPRSLPGGRTLCNPPVIRSTPRNLNNSVKIQATKSSDGVNTEISLCSPIMRKRLSELATERREQVEAHSKSTSTELQCSRGLDASPPKKRLLRQHLWQEKHRVSSPAAASAMVGNGDTSPGAGSSSSSKSTYKDLKENKSPSNQVLPLDSGFESDNDEGLPKNSQHKTGPESNLVTKANHVDLKRDNHLSGFQVVTPTKSKPQTSGDSFLQNRSSPPVASQKAATKCVTNSPGRVYRMARHSGSSKKGKGLGKASNNKSQLVKRSSSASAPLNLATSNQNSNLKAWFQLQAQGGCAEACPHRSKSSTGHQPPKDKNHNCISGKQEREKQDMLLAMKLQAEFDLEAKYQLNALRKQQVDGEYSLRTRKKTDQEHTENSPGKESRRIKHNENPT